MENPIKMDDLGVPLIFGNIQLVKTSGRWQVPKSPYLSVWKKKDDCNS